MTVIFKLKVHGKRLHKKHEMYMGNAKVLRLVTNANYIPLTRIGGFALGNVKNVRHPTQEIPTWCFLRLVTQTYPRLMVLRRSGI